MIKLVLVLVLGGSSDPLTRIDNFVGILKHAYTCMSVYQSCPWVGLTHWLGWVGSGWVKIFQFSVGWVGFTNISNFFSVLWAQCLK